MQTKPDETSTSLLDAAHQLLSEHGSEALTVRRIATQAGMSTMNVYSRFGGKDGVVDELYIDGFERLYERIDAVPFTDDAATDLLEMAREYRRFALDNPTYYGVMFRSAISEFTPSARATELSLSGLTRLVGRVEAGQANGQIRVGDEYQPQVVAAWLWASCHGLVSLELFGIGDEMVSWADVFDIGMRTATDGLRPSMSSQR